MTIQVSKSSLPSSSTGLIVTIEKAITENLGSCSFLATADDTNTAGFAYRVRFSDPIKPNSLTTSDIVNVGTGGGSGISYTLTNCGDDRNFSLAVTAVNGDGTIIPTLPPNRVLDLNGNVNLASTSTNSTVNFDSANLNVSIEQAISESVGSCIFSAPSDPSSEPGFSFKITFSKFIQASSFTASDVTNSGTGGAIDLEWSLSSCNDGRNYSLTVTNVEGEGTIIPLISANLVSDPAGNLNTASTGVDSSIMFLWGWYQEAYIKASNAEAGDWLGYGVSIYGDTLVAGAHREDSAQTTITNGPTASADNTALESGAAYVFKRNGNIWTQEAYIKSVNNRTNNSFGGSVSLDKDTLVVGASFEASSQTTITNGPTADNTTTNNAAGAIYVYRRTGTNWTQEAYIKAASNNGGGDYFGERIKLHGETLVVGVPYDDSNQTTITNGSGASIDNSLIDSGAVFVYRRNGTNWTQEAYIKSVNPDSTDYFGTSVSIYQDTIAVGVTNDDSNLTSITNGTTASTDNSTLNSGAVYVFRRIGTNWSQEAYIKAVNSGSLYYFGKSVSLYGDTLAVGSSDASNQSTITNGSTASNDSSASDSGAVYVYKRIGTNWAQEAFIKASNNRSSNGFGSTVAIDEDTLVVGAPTEGSNQVTITNGNTASSDTSVFQSGAIYVFSRNGVNWVQEAYIKSGNTQAWDQFGTAISISGDTIAAGFRNDDSNLTTISNGTSVSTNTSSGQSGSVFVYRNNSRLFEVGELFITPGATDVSFSWLRTGRYATGYYLSYQAGTTAPATCTSGTSVDLGDVTNHLENNLTSATTYSFRICSTRDGITFSRGVTATVTTL